MSYNQNSGGKKGNVKGPAMLSWIVFIIILLFMSSAFGRAGIFIIAISGVTFWLRMLGSKAKNASTTTSTTSRLTMREERDGGFDCAHQDSIHLLDEMRRNGKISDQAYRKAKTELAQSMGKLDTSKSTGVKTVQKSYFNQVSYAKDLGDFDIQSKPVGKREGVEKDDPWN